MSKELCKCYHLTKADIKAAVKDGASSYKEVKHATKVGKACGKCKKKAKKYAEKRIAKA